MLLRTLHPYKQRLATLGLPMQQLQAEWRWLLEAIFSQRYEALMLQETPPSPSQRGRLEAFIAERIEKRTPLQYLLGEAWFYGHPFTVSPAVLIPRPETELLVEATLVAMQAQQAAEPREVLRWVDVGTGSGCIAITLLLEAHRLGIPLQVLAVDVSPEALAVAVQNATRHGLNEGVFIPLLGDTLEPVLAGGYDVQGVVSNPPYIAPTLAESLLPEVLQHEPHLALFAEGEGFAMVEQLATQAAILLPTDGRLLVEVGAGMTERTQALLQQAGFQSTQAQQDYAGFDRWVEAIR